MRCLTPVTIKTPDKVNLKKKVSEVSPTMHVPCGSCPACLNKRSQMWIFRLQEEKKVSNSAYFITLTYDDDNVPRLKSGEQTLVKKDLQLFMKRLRKREKGQKLKYYSVGEYGSKTQRPHYHTILFNVSNLDNINKSWNHGHIRIDECNVKTIAYVTKYVLKQTKFKNPQDPRIREFSMMSKGLGKSYLSKAKIKYMKNHPEPYLTLEGGQKMALPRYFKDKVYNEKEKDIINEKSKIYVEKNLKEFESFHHENEWKKDKFRLRDKIAVKKRDKL